MADHRPAMQPSIDTIECNYATVNKTLGLGSAGVIDALAVCAVSKRLDHRAQFGHCLGRV